MSAILLLLLPSMARMHHSFSSSLRWFPMNAHDDVVEGYEDVLDHVPSPDGFPAPIINSRRSIFTLKHPSIKISRGILRQDVIGVDANPFIQKITPSKFLSIGDELVQQVDEFKFKINEEQLLKLSKSIDSDTSATAEVRQLLDKSGTESTRSLLVDKSFAAALNKAEIVESEDTITYKLDLDYDEFNKLFVEQQQQLEEKSFERQKEEFSALLDKYRSQEFEYQYPGSDALNTKIYGNSRYKSQMSLPLPLGILAVLKQLLLDSFKAKTIRSAERGIAATALVFVLFCLVDQINMRLINFIKPAALTRIFTKLFGRWLVLPIRMAFITAAFLYVFGNTDSPEE